MSPRQNPVYASRMSHNAVRSQVPCPYRTIEHIYHYVPEKPQTKYAAQEHPYPRNAPGHYWQKRIHPLSPIHAESSLSVSGLSQDTNSVPCTPVSFPKPFLLPHSRTPEELFSSLKHQPGLHSL